jgi:class 3 adenylate cyclase
LGVRLRSDIATPDELDGERKTVTALFADIKGSTELMEDLDPEEARAIIDPALKLMIEAVRRYDGYVVQSTGMASSRCSGRRWRTRTIRNGRYMRRSGCRRS